MRYQGRRTSQTDIHAIHMDRPAVTTKMMVKPTSLLSITPRLNAKKTKHIPTRTSAPKTILPVTKGAVVSPGAVCELCDICGEGERVGCAVFFKRGGGQSV
jgi:hypothetical protein